LLMHLFSGPLTSFAGISHLIMFFPKCQYEGASGTSV
jgi:hypothetical protein